MTKGQPDSDRINSPLLQALSHEAQRVEESAMFSAQAQFESGRLWKIIGYSLGIPSSALAAVAGVTSLAEVTTTFTSGLIALTAAALGAILTLLNTSHRMNSATSAGNQYLQIQTAARQLRNITMISAAAEECQTKLAELTSIRDELNNTAEPAGKLAYKRATKNIKAGHQRYKVDD